MKYAVVDMSTQILLKRRWDNFMDLKKSVKEDVDLTVDQHGIYSATLKVYTHLIVQVEE